jgi:nicotinate-nucleotide adenylyltransferase
MGGTFDPIHYGHLVVAEEVWFRLKLDKVLFVPAAQPPHKLGKVITPAVHRLEMVRLAVQENPHFDVSSLEVERPGPSYTVDTLAQLRASMDPEDDIWLILGMDSLAELPTWRQPERILQLARLAVVPRPGYVANIHELEKLLPGISKKTSLIPTPELAISAENLRARVAEGYPIKYQLPEAVEEYIYSMGLYRFR